MPGNGHRSTRARLSAPSIGQRMDADIAACTAIAPGIGTQAALLPSSVEHDGEWLHVRLYADQARGADAREDARLVRWFNGWAAVNGGGPKAEAASRRLAHGPQHSHRQRRRALCIEMARRQSQPVIRLRSSG